MSNPVQQINLWMGIVLASLSTSATAYYLYMLMAPHAWPVQVLSATTGIALEIARYSLQLSRERVLPLLLFVVSVGCSWAALNTAYVQWAGPNTAYLLSEYKDDRERALREVERLVSINYLTKAKEVREHAAELLAKIDELERTGRSDGQIERWINQFLMVAIALLVNITSIRCLSVATRLEAPKREGRERCLEEPERGVSTVEDTPREVLSEPISEPALVPPAPVLELTDSTDDPLLSKAKELIERGELRLTKNALKTRFGIGWDRANKLYLSLTETNP